ncbi:MAG: hypothetical protein LBS52_04960 [Dysgonamonadaceae bacterium]|jgi:hypothetical protein|nr:hypothetical protein [Dysgonamonadaceae bacterium]
MRQFRLIFSLLLLFAVASTAYPAGKKRFVVQFDNSKEVSGRKFAIADITPGLPLDWDEYNYVVLDFRMTSPQRFHIGFNTADGYNELRIMNYVPGAWNKLAIPLKFYRHLPGAAVDLAATYNQPRFVGWVNLGGRRGPLHGVDSIGIRMRAPIGKPTFEIRSIALAKEDPGDKYLGDKPAVDKFGQWNLAEWEGKIHSEKELKAQWEAEDALPVSADEFNYSQYGGYRQAQVKATGFFRTEKIDGKWWFVDPEGYLFLSVGVDCVAPGGGGMVRDVEKRLNMFSELPPDSLIYTRYGRDRRQISFGTWNLYRRYGKDYRNKANENIINRMTRWGLNTIANWSSGDVMALNRKAFILQLQNIGIDYGLMGLTDVYDKGFAPKAEKAIRDFVTPQKDNPWLIGYFLGNEPAWLGQETRLCEMILSGGDRAIKTELQKHLQQSGDTPEQRKKFIFNTFNKFIAIVNQFLKKYDPNHLNMGIRFGSGHLEPEMLQICKSHFDVFSFNCYELSPNVDMMNRTLESTGLPMIIGEYHFGTVDRGMAQSLWQVDSQQERGVAYRYYTEQAYSHPGLIGTAYFQWCDQDLTGRFDGENYNCGFVDVTDRPYPHQVEAVKATARRLYGVHSGSVEPFVEQPRRARGHGGIPDEW